MKNKSVIAFKGAVETLSVLNIQLTAADIGVLRSELQSLCGDTPDFFDENPAILDVGALPGQGADIDWPSLVELLRGARLNPLAVRHAAPAAEKAIRAAGLTLAEEIEAAPRKPLADPEPPPAVAAIVEPPPVPTVQKQLDLTPPPAPAPAAKPLPAMVIDRPLRSGQQVYARGADLVVLAMVNPGAEVMADGNIHVYAPLRGRALAGAAGDTSARILTTCFEAELVSVGGVYRPLEPGMPREVSGKPAQVRIVDGEGGKQMMRIEALAIA